MEKMKHLLIVLFLFIGNVFTEDKFPIKLTCEIGDTSFLVNVGSIPRTTWMELHPSSKKEIKGVFGSYQSILGFPRDKRLYAKKGNNYKRFFVTDNRIEFVIKVAATDYYFFINRLSGGIEIWHTIFHGQCFKGFKGYKERKF